MTQTIILTWLDLDDILFLILNVRADLGRAGEALQEFLLVLEHEIDARPLRLALWVFRLLRDRRGLWQARRPRPCLGFMV